MDVGRNEMTETIDDVMKELGFENYEEFIRLVFEADISTSEKLVAFKKWQLEDGTKEGLLKLEVEK
jgi:hypothetical protein